METQPKTPEKRGKIKDLSIIKTIKTQPKTLEKRGDIDLQISSPKIQIEDLSEEKQFLRKKTIQKSTRPIHQTKNQKLSLVINLLQKIYKDKNEETDQLQIKILLQIIKKNIKKINQSESYRKKLNLVKTPTSRSLCFKNRLQTLKQIW